MTWIGGVLICLLAAVSYRFGYEVAHSTIAIECERLGSFYVGNKTYKCIEIIDAKDAK